MVAIKVIYGTEWCGDCKRSKAFLLEHEIPFEWIDVDEDQESAEKVKEINNGKRSVPTIIFDDGSILVEPSNGQLANKLGIEYN